MTSDRQQSRTLRLKRWLTSDVERLAVLGVLTGLVAFGAGIASGNVAVGFGLFGIAWLVILIAIVQNMMEVTDV